jgi:hypothetical protein
MKYVFEIATALAFPAQAKQGAHGADQDKAVPKTSQCKQILSGAALPRSAVLARDGH